MSPPGPSEGPIGLLPSSIVGPVHVLIDGVATPPEAATVSVFDWSLQRGYGCFEVIRSYDGKVFRGPEHAARLGRSLAALHLIGPDAADVEAWVAQAAAAGGDGLIRVLVTAGSRDPRHSSPPRTVVIWEPLPDLPDQFRLLPLAAPWHAAGAFSELTGAKTLSYAPNMAATLEAERRGYHDALLVSREGVVLEGPTFIAAWVAGAAIELPSLDLGLLASITRQATLEVAERLGIEVREGTYPLERLLGADEAMVLSTVKQVAPAIQIGAHEIPTGPVTAKLAAGFADLVAAEVGYRPA